MEKSEQRDEWPLVKVVWEDAASDWGDLTLEEVLAKDLPIRESVGFLVHRDKKRIVIAGTDDRRCAYPAGKTPVADITRIPRSLVHRIVRMHPEGRRAVKKGP